MPYAKQNFKDGDVLTARNLTLIEDGIVSKQDSANLTTNISSASDHVHYPSAKAVYDFAAAGLMTTQERSKLLDIESGATKTIVDDSLQEDSTNPVENRVIYNALANKANTTDIHDGTLTIKQNNAVVNVFNANDTNDVTANIDAYTTNEIDNKFKTVPVLDSTNLIPESYMPANVTQHLANTTAHVTTADKQSWNDKYTKAEIDNFVFITVDDIDAICGATIQVANSSDVTF